MNSNCISEHVVTCQKCFTAFAKTRSVMRVLHSFFHGAIFLNIRLFRGMVGIQTKNNFVVLERNETEVHNLPFPFSRQAICFTVFLFDWIAQVHDPIKQFDAMLHGLTCTLLNRHSILGLHTRNFVVGRNMPPNTEAHNPKRKDPRELKSRLRTGMSHTLRNISKTSAPRKKMKPWNLHF